MVTTGSVVVVVVVGTSVGVVVVVVVVVVVSSGGGAGVTGGKVVVVVVSPGAFPVGAVGIVGIEETVVVCGIYHKFSDILTILSKNLQLEVVLVLVQLELALVSNKSSPKRPKLKIFLSF